MESFSMKNFQRQDDFGPKAAAAGRYRTKTRILKGGCVPVALIHLAQISYRLGRTLHFDPKTLACKEDEEANRMFTWNYRAPFVVPAQI